MAVHVWENTGLARPRRLLRKAEIRQAESEAAQWTYWRCQKCGMVWASLKDPQDLIERAYPWVATCEGFLVFDIMEG